MGDGNAVIVEQQYHHRGAHAFVLGILAGGSKDVAIGLLDGAFYGHAFTAVTGGFIDFTGFDIRQALFQAGDYSIYRDGTGNFATFVAAHAVGQYHQAQFGIAGNTVFVMVSDHALIGLAGDEYFVLQIHCLIRPCWISQ